MSPTCHWCGKTKEKMTEWENSVTKERIHLCFRGCQHFPEPFRNTDAGRDERDLVMCWSRVDPYQNYIRRQPGLQGKRRR